MNIEKLIWVTDIHLNFLDKPEREAYYQTLTALEADSLLISGDIGEAESVFVYLKEIASAVNHPIYFVLGNHDFYRGTVTGVHEKIRNCAKINSHLHWLGNGKAINLNSSTVLVGVDAWADGRYGDFFNSPVIINDSRLISDLFLAKMLGKNALHEKMCELADIDAAILNKSLTRSINPSTEKVIICVHVPPFAESCTHEERPTNIDWLPFFSSKAIGDVIFAWAKKYPHIVFNVYCGHTHSRHEHAPLSNLRVKVGQATYGYPEIQEVVKI